MEKVIISFNLAIEILIVDTCTRLCYCNSKALCFNLAIEILIVDTRAFQTFDS